MSPTRNPVCPDPCRPQDVRDATEILRMLTGDEPDAWPGCSADGPTPLEH